MTELSVKYSMPIIGLSMFNMCIYLYIYQYGLDFRHHVTQFQVDGSQPIPPALPI